jgi:hypothetical protein
MVGKIIRRVAKWLLVLMLLCALVLAGLAFYVLPRIERALDAELREEFSLPASAVVDIRRGSVMNSLRGIVPAAHIESPEAVLDELPVERLSFDAVRVHFDLSGIWTGGDAELLDATGARISLYASDDAVAARWGDELAEEGLKKPELEFDAKGVKASALWDTGLFDVRVSARGRFKVDGSQRIRLHITEVEAAGIKLDISKLNAVYSELTPPVQLDRYAMDIMIDTAETTADGYLYVTAHTGDYPATGE